MNPIPYLKLLFIKKPVYILVQSLDFYSVVDYRYRYLTQDFVSFCLHYKENTKPFSSKDTRMYAKIVTNVSCFMIDKKLTKLNIVWQMYKYDYFNNLKIVRIEVDNEIKL